MYHVVVRERKILAVIGFVLCIMSTVFLVFGVRDGIYRQNTAELFIYCLLFGALIALGLVMIVAYFLRRLCLGYNGCYYRTMFGRKKEFYLRDIAKVESKIFLGDLLIIFYDSNGKKLAQVENNMKNAEEVFPFLEEYQLPALHRDALGKSEELWRQVKEKYEKHIGNRYYPERQREKRRKIEEEWKNNPAFYENKRWIRRIRICKRLLNIIGVVVFLIAVCSSGRAEALCCMLYPLAVWMFYLVFHRVVVWDTKTIPSEREKEDYVTVPYLPAILLFLYGIFKTGDINIEETWKIIIFCIVFGAVMFLSLRCIRTSKGYTELAIPVFILLMYCYLSIYYWNCALRIGEPEHINAVIAEKRISEGSKSDSYYFMLRTKDGDKREASVSGSLYHEAETGDTVRICRQVSVFGIHYYYVHW